MHNRATHWALVVTALLGLAACASDPRQPPPSAEPSDVDGPVVSPFEPCPQPPASAPSSGSSSDPAAGPDADVLTGITLACFDQRTDVALAQLGRPAVVNLWASWCEPCRRELPELQRLAENAGDDLVVLGVVTEDSRERAAALAQDLAVTFPAVFDPSAEVRRAAGALGLPLTLFVGPDGGVRHVHRTGALDLPTATELVRTHLGVELG